MLQHYNRVKELQSLSLPIVSLNRKNLLRKGLGLKLRRKLYKGLIPLAFLYFKCLAENIFLSLFLGICSKIHKKKNHCLEMCRIIFFNISSATDFFLLHLVNFLNRNQTVQPICKTPSIYKPPPFKNCVLKTFDLKVLKCNEQDTNTSKL